MKKPLLSTVLNQYLQSGMISNTQLKHINRWLKTIFKDMAVGFNEDYCISVFQGTKTTSFEDPEAFVEYITHLIQTYNNEHGIKNTNSVYTLVNGVKKQLPNEANILRKAGG